MAICIQCDHCQSKFQAAACHAGKTTRCPKCRQPLKVPTTAHTPPAKSAGSSHPPQLDQPADTAVHTDLPQKTSQAKPTPKNGKPTRTSEAKRLLNGFSGPIKKARPTLRYRLSTVLVAIVMVLLPLIYLALIGVVGYGIYYHTVNHAGLLEVADRPRSYIFMALLYSAPILCGIILILFMFKPFFARQATDIRSRSLKRDIEPLLFEFIDRICQTVGAPKPTRIDLDCQLNASASYGQGLSSILGNQLILTIGMPLVASLNTRQFAGVMAHEFGHFAQGAGMRLTYLIRYISHWLHRVVYQRDAADQWLEQAADALDIRLSWILYLAMFFVWITRQILWVLMMVGHFLGSYLLRQMEFDADRYETRLAGSETFMQTAVGLQILGAATQKVYEDLDRSSREGQLVNDLPEMILHKAEQMPEAIHEAILSSIEETPTRWFDTHPADRDRIASAQQENTEGVFQIEMPASVLFSDFKSQSQATTWEFYREIFGNNINRSQLVPIDHFVTKQELANVSQDSLDQFFLGHWTVSLPFALRYKHSQPAENAQATLNELKSTRELMLAEMATAAEAFQSLRQAQAQLAMAVKIRHCCRAGIEVEIDGLSNNKDGEKEANRIETSANKNIVAANRTLEPYQQAATNRLGSALQLLHAPQVAKRIPNSSQAQHRCQELLECYTALSGQMPTLLQVMHLHGVLGILIQRLPEDDDNDSYLIAIQGITRQMSPAISMLRKTWTRCAYPYSSPDNQLTLGKYLIPELPISDQASSIFNGCDQAVTAAFPLYMRLLGDLTLIAEAVEKALGLPPLPEPTSPEE